MGNVNVVAEEAELQFAFGVGEQEVVDDEQGILLFGGGEDSDLKVCKEEVEEVLEARSSKDTHAVRC